MKRTLTILLALTMLFALTACGEDDTAETATPTEEVEETVEPTEDTSAAGGVATEAGAFTIGAADDSTTADFEYAVDEDGVQIVFTAGEDITNFNFFNLSGDVSGDTSGEASGDVSSDASGDTSGDASSDTSADTTDTAETTDTSDTSYTDDAAGSSDAPATGEVTTDSSDKYAVGKTLYTVDVIAEGETVVITLTWPETEPGYGFSYTDADGVEHRFAMSSNPDAADDAEAEPVLVEEF